MQEDDGSDLFASDRRQPAPRILTTSGPARPMPVGTGLLPAPAPAPVPAPAPLVAAPPKDWEGVYDAAPMMPPQVDGSYIAGPAPARWYVGAEYLLWRTKNDQAPPLLTTGSLPLFVGNLPAGALGRGDTVVLQDGNIDHGWQSGGRFTAGFFLDDCAEKAIEVSGFFLGQRSARANVSSAQTPIIARPFFDVNQGQEAVELVTFPGLSTGRATVNAPSQLWGLEANLACKACCGCDYRVNWLAGARFLSLRESITIQEDVTTPASAQGAGLGLQDTRALITDRFATSNQFYGGQVGAEGRWIRGRFTLDGKAKIALGVTQQSLDVSGTQVFLRGVNPDPRPGGALALPSNIGHFTRSRVAVIPEVGATIGYYATDWMRVSVGYNFLYWSDVVRPGDQIDRNINTNQVPNFGVTPFNTNPPPQRLFRSTDYWAQGLTFGVELNY